MSDMENLIARLRKQADNAGAVMDRIADQGSIEDGDAWAIDEHVEAYELAEVATLVIATLEAVTAERDSLAAVIERVKANLADREYILIQGVLDAAPSVSLAEHDAQVLEAAADRWTQGAWADTPRRADRVADRMVASQYAGDWLRAEAARLREEGNRG